MAIHLLPPLLPATVQTQLLARWPESRFRQPVTARRLAYAERRGIEALAGRDRKSFFIKQQFLFFLPEHEGNVTGPVFFLDGSGFFSDGNQKRVPDGAR